MKKLICSLALLAFGLVQAQETPTTGGGFNQGDIFITGSIGIGSESTGDNKTNSFNISPKAGYFLTPNIALGVALGYTSGKEEAPGTPDVKTSELSVGAFGRYYVTPANSFSVFGELGVDYIHSKIEAVTEDNSNAMRIGLAPGVSYFISQNFALEAKFGILSYRTDNPDADGVENTDQFNFGLNLSDISIGAIYRF
ncbi:outer membrane beta-barrel protein [Flavobacterium sp. Sd200]|uniref:outer membrane beta-barrel protein n=1 Tax=Flavobacterium sp. Sd200 TaxID=2692211 RepID=UPI001367F9C4|nr:outer membrane beta-barrel protein [Flavobacterium sp. Sd200]MXN91028.1 outer membrane beta-barrel protein [Flavobacterium sp. Sd200]